MAEWSPQERRELIRWINQYAGARGKVLVRLATFLERLFRAQSPDDFYTLGAWVDEAAGQSAATQKTLAELRTGYLERVLAVNGVATDFTGIPVPTDPRGVPQSQVWARPAEQYRYARSAGDPDPLGRAVGRALTIAEDDAALAERVVTRTALRSVKGVRGYRRLVHPEMSQGGSCGLCVAAADQMYSVGDLMPIHTHCRCSVMPVIAGRPDPKSLNGKFSYEDVASAAGSTSASDLSNVRVRVTDHSELGPTLVYAKGSTRIDRVVMSDPLAA